MFPDEAGEMAAARARNSNPWMILRCCGRPHNDPMTGTATMPLEVAGLLVSKAI